MTELKRLQHEFADYQERNVPDYVFADYQECDVYDYVANELFDLTTYDSAIDEILVKRIMTTLEWVTTEFPLSSRSKNTSEAELTEHIITLNLGNVVDWVDWGTSIRHPWIDFDKVETYLAVKELIRLNTTQTEIY